MEKTEPSVRVFNGYTYDVQRLTDEFNLHIKHRLITVSRVQDKMHIMLYGEINIDFYDDLLYTKQIISELSDLFSFKDVTFRSIRPKKSYPMHIDGPVAYHLPIITNENCWFEYSNHSKFLMPATGEMYAADTDVLHTFVNNSDVARVHLLVETMPGVAATRDKLKTFFKTTRNNYTIK